MFDLVLYQPEIPPNTGNIIRLCANTSARLHLVKPLGFEITDKHLRRAGLDYHEYASMQVHESWEDCLNGLQGRRMFAMTTKGSTRYTEIKFEIDDVFVMGPETRGLPPEILAQFAPDRRLRLPMMPQNRSLNLSNSAAVLLYEAWRQNDFEGGV
jgi:tRNA (cytidine/uridine-2'-O-)-methyltransferase